MRTMYERRYIPYGVPCSGRVGCKNVPDNVCDFPTGMVECNTPLCNACVIWKGSTCLCPRHALWRQPKYVVGHRSTQG